MDNDDYSYDLENIQLDLNKENSPYFLVQRYIVECSYLSAEAKGYYAMFSSGYYDWCDVPKHIRDELNAIPQPEVI